MTKVPTIKLSKDVSMPVFGLGTWNSPADEVKLAVRTALEAGYRHIDCALVYGNEKEIGEELAQSMKKLNLKREDIFITTKLWCTHFRRDLVRKCCETSLKNLQIPYIDLYLVHWPVALKPGDELLPRTEDGFHFAPDKVPLLETWKAMEELVTAGLVKTIGVSNFNRRQLDLILKNCNIKPVNLQVEIHANFMNSKLVDYARSKGLTITAYSPLGSPAAAPGEVNLLTEPWVCEVAKRYNKSAAQVLLRLLLQLNIAVVPKSVTPSRIISNFQVFDFTLKDEDVHTLSTKGLNQRQLVSKEMELSDEYPFKDEF
ncbi:unnamed protein product [Dicrocoelium dendriticum]|nr:unnamed protein product [Dicrocoelium dendriticum]